MARSPAPELADFEPSSIDPNELADRLRGQYDEIAQLAGGLAHEIRNPLSTMRLNLDLLAEDFRDPANDRERRALQKIDRVRKESHRLEGLLEDFLRFIRVGALPEGPADLNAVVEDIRDFCEPQSLAQGIVTRSQADPDLPEVPLHVDAFKQAVLNLVRNAQHAMTDGGELILRTRFERPEGWAVLEVIDTGPGIAPEALPRVFEPFFSTRARGTGLGLPLTRRIVEAHGGSIDLESERGKGTQFTIRLPIGVSGGPGGPA